MKKQHVILVFILLSNICWAQNFADKNFYLVDSLDVSQLHENDKSLIDSLMKEYHQTKEDTVHLSLLNKLVSECENKIWIKYNELIIKKASEGIKNNTSTGRLLYNFKKHLSSGYNNYGFLYYQQDNIEKAINYFEKAISLSEEIGDKTVIPTALNNIGFILKQQGDIIRALEYYHKSLKLNKELNEKEEVALSLNNIGSIYFKQNEYNKALNYYREALLLEKEAGTTKGVARLYSNIGSVYLETKRFKEALEYFSQSYKLYEELNIERGKANSLSKLTIAESMLLDENNQQKYTSGLNVVLLKHKQALQIYNSIDDNEGISYALCNISNTYRMLREYNLALQYGQMSLLKAKALGYPENIKNAAEAVKKAAQAKKDFKLAFNMQELYYQMIDSIASQSVREATLQRQFQYEYEKKVLADSIKNAEKQKIVNAQLAAKDEKIKRQTTERYGLSGGILVLLIFGTVSYRRYKSSQRQKKIIQEQKNLVEQKSKEINDSINYAKNIQDSIIPTEKEFTSQLKNAFVFYLPKDIVSGDFYWLEKSPSTTISKHGETSILFAAADCTGHGVPGAMVSVVCNGALNRSVGEYGLTNPAAILNKTRELVIKTFERSNDESKLRDGMDIALCNLRFDVSGLMLNNPETIATLEYAGANNPLWLIRNNQLTEIKADKQPIGKHFRNESYTHHQLQLQQGDTIYIFSDGYADQFGGPKGKKMMYKPFKEFLLSIQHLDMEEQQKAVANHFYQWKGENEQVDDVCVIGVRV